MSGISGTSSADAWTVGDHDYAPAEPIIRHWDGTRWHPVPQERLEGNLFGVAAISPTDAWAVGGFGTPLAMHWDGAGWTEVQTPRPGSSAGLNEVVAISSEDVWAVGHYVDQIRGHGLAMHWDGVQWSVYPDAPSPHGIYFHAVSASASDDVWAVGYKTVSLGKSQPVIEHWDGVAWSAVPTPEPHGTSNVLYDVAAISSDDAWAVGTYGFPPASPPQSLVMHWDGTSWSQVDVPVPDQGGTVLSGISATGSHDAWAVGSAFRLLRGGKPLVEHWDGVSWSLVKAPNYSGDAGPVAVSAIAPDDIWIAGVYFNEDLHDSTPLTEHSRGVCPPG